MSYDFLTGNGKTGKVIAQIDWTNHPLGPIEKWPESLRSTLGSCLHSPHPLSIYWGKEMYLFYNDFWAPFLGEKDPAAMGQPAKEVWKDIWQIIHEPMERVLENGEGYIERDAELPIFRQGFIEETFFDYSFSPIFDNKGKTAGILNIGTETTQRVLNERRARTLRRLLERSITAESSEAACIIGANALTEAPRDIPFALFYLLNTEGTELRLAATTSIDTDDPIAIQKITLTSTDYILPYHDVIDTRKTITLDNIASEYTLPGGEWDEPSVKISLVPLTQPGSKALYGLIVFGISPRLAFDDSYKEFYQRITDHVAVSIGNANTLKKQLDLESREQRARNELQRALSSGSIGVWSWDVEENVVRTDHNMAAQFGIDKRLADKGLPLNVFLESVHPDDLSMLNKNIESALKTRQPFEAEYRTVVENGSTRWVIARGRVETDPVSKRTRFPGVMVDITERKQIEEKLARAELLFNTLFESTILGVVVATMGGQIEQANETFLKMFGYTRRDLKKGLTSQMITPSKSRAVTAMIYDQLRKKGEADPTEKEYVRKDGSALPIMIGAVMIPDSTDRFLAFMLDISEQRQLVELNHAKDEFISIASHQLRTPATGVKQYIGMLLEGYVGELTPEQKEILQTAYESNERQLAIVNDLLKVAQADAQEITLNRETVDVTKLITDVIDEQSKKYQDKQQTIQFQHPHAQVRARLDPFHIRMVFENLIDNAHKYSPPDKAVIVSLKATKRKITIRIKDEGVGIRKIDQPKLFKKFSRIHNSLSTSAGGTGLGLYWVDKIVSLHGGSTEVESVYKRGTEFVITLPTVTLEEEHA
jgi:PAS domain S-box-containing protein